MAMAFIPVLANLVLLQSRNLLGSLGKTAADLTGEAATAYTALLLLGNGFIITALIWAAALAKVIDHQFKVAAGFLGVAALASLIGLVHSPLADGRLFWPWAAPNFMPPLFAAAYLLVAVALLLQSAQQTR